MLINAKELLENLKNQDKMSAISFFNEDIDFVLTQKGVIKKWISDVISLEGKTKGNISFIFCNDEYLSKINIEYLKHDTFTDIITFDYTEDNYGKISGDIFISIERVKENAEKLNISFINELHRVMIHGILHLMGYKDKTKANKIQMRLKEDKCLSLQKNN